MKIWKMLTKKQRKKAMDEVLSACNNDKDLEKLKKMDQILKGRFPSLKYYITGMGSNMDDPNKLIFKFNIEFDATDFNGLTNEEAESLQKELLQHCL